MGIYDKGICDWRPGPRRHWRAKVRIEWWIGWNETLLRPVLGTVMRGRAGQRRRRQVCLAPKARRGPGWSPLRQATLRGAFVERRQSACAGAVPSSSVQRGPVNSNLTRIARTASQSRRCKSRL